MIEEKPHSSTYKVNLILDGVAFMDFWKVFEKAKVSANLYWDDDHDGFTLIVGEK